MTGEPGWFLFDGLVKHDLQTGREQRYALRRGRVRQRDAVRPRAGATAEDDGYLITFTTDLARDCSECLVFDAADLTGRADRVGSAPRAHLQRDPLLLDLGHRPLSR